jgi:hypothetical protein
MKRAIASLAVLILAGVAALAAQAQEKKPGMVPSTVAQTPEWQKLKTLVGQWDGVMEEEGKQIPATLEVRLTGDGSAMMHVMAKDTPQEMVTMFHPDGKRLLATHYCAAHNQPRMALAPAKAPNQVAFAYIDGTNLAPGDMHITNVVITFVDADHHEEAWTSSAGPTQAVFKYTRKK